LWWQFRNSKLNSESCCGVQLTMILNESLRLYPPTIATIRRSKADVELGGYKIPRGTELLIPILALHHDQSIWGHDANEFNPRRFSNGVARAAKHHVAFIPFGLGVRTCIGQNLAILQAKLTLAIILQRFSFRLATSYQHAPTVLMLLYPQHGAPIIFQRLPNPWWSIIKYSNEIKAHNNKPIPILSWECAIKNFSKFPSKIYNIVAIKISIGPVRRSRSSSLLAVYNGLSKKCHCLHMYLRTYPPSSFPPS